MAAGCGLWGWEGAGRSREIRKLGDWGIVAGPWRPRQRRGTRVAMGSG